MLQTIPTHSPSAWRKKSLLALVHVEEDFRDGFPDPLYVQRLVKAHKSRKYDEILHLVGGDGPIGELAGLGAGLLSWDPNTLPAIDEPEELTWMIPSSGGSAQVWVAPEIRAFPWMEYRVTLGGGCTVACLRDFEAILQRLNVPYRLVRGYTY